jgi:hypothetical protein
VLRHLVQPNDIGEPRAITDVLRIGILSYSALTYSHLCLMECTYYRPVADPTLSAYLKEGCPASSAGTVPWPSDRPVFKRSSVRTDILNRRAEQKERTLAGMKSSSPLECLLTLVELMERT